MEMYDGISDMELSLWEKLPDVSKVLCSKKMGAWLLRRDKNKEAQKKADNTAYWIRLHDCNHWYKCSECYSESDENTPFCPRCGYEMTNDSCD